VPKEDLLNAIALNSTALSFMRIGGGSIAGLLLIPFDTGGVYLITAAVYTLVILSTSLMHLPDEKGKVRKETGLLADVREGFVYVGQNRVLAWVVGLAVILFVLGFPYQRCSCRCWRRTRWTWATRAWGSWRARRVWGRSSGRWWWRRSRACRGRGCNSSSTC
jgi:hypothetical protein